MNDVEQMAEKIRAALAEMTPGPWVVFPDDENLLYYGIESPSRTVVISGYPDGDGDDGGVRGETMKKAAANAHGIVTLRNLVPTLLDELDRLRADVHDCPVCGVACKQCRCTEERIAALESERDKLRNAVSGLEHQVSQVVAERDAFSTWAAKQRSEREHLARRAHDLTDEVNELRAALMEASVPIEALVMSEVGSGSLCHEAEEGLLATSKMIRRVLTSTPATPPVAYPWQPIAREKVFRLENQLHEAKERLWAAQRHCPHLRTKHHGTEYQSISPESWTECLDCGVTTR